MITETKIRGFLVLARLLNYTRAAEELFITQQTLSSQISALEKDLGFRLFDRSTTKVALTPAGLRFQRLAEDASRGLEEIRREYCQEQPFVLRVACFEDTDIGPEILQAKRKISAAYKNFDIDLKLEPRFSGMIEKLNADVYDLILFPMGVIPAGRMYRTRIISQDYMFFFVSPKYPGAHPDMEIKELKDATFFVSADAANLRSDLSRKMYDITGTYPHFTGNRLPYEERMMVECGEGIGLGGTRSLYNRNKTLFRIPWNGGVSMPSVLAVWLNGKNDTLIQSYLRELSPLLEPLDT